MAKARFSLGGMLVGIAAAAVAFTVAFVIVPQVWGFAKESPIPELYIRRACYALAIGGIAALVLVGIWFWEEREPMEPPKDDSTPPSHTD